MNNSAAIPFPAMGRFSHEAIAVDPRTGILYETEDAGDSGFYRFTPTTPGNLLNGGVLEMLKIKDVTNYDTRTGQTVGVPLPVEWVLINTPDPPGQGSNDVYDQGFAGGAAIFIEVTTDNANRTVADIRHQFTRHGGNLGAANSVAWMFDRKALIVVDATKADEDATLEAVLDAGADDMTRDGDTFVVTTQPGALHAVRDTLGEIGPTGVHRRQHHIQDDQVVSGRAGRFQRPRSVAAGIDDRRLRFAEPRQHVFPVRAGGRIRRAMPIGRGRCRDCGGQRQTRGGPGRDADLQCLQAVVDGGALAVENALKAAMDWKVRKNLRRGLPADRGTQVLHFREAFHGRSGYALSLTNTADPRKYQYFARFDWPRVSNPKLCFPVHEDELERGFALAAAHPVCKGFAVGRSIFMDAARQWFSNAISDQEVISRVGTNYSRLVAAWRKAREACKESVS